jgi:hypothetical protein
VPAFTGTTPAVITATEGQSFSGTVASFTTNAPFDTFIGQIDWGDGTTTTGTVTPTGPNSFQVTGAHAYADEHIGLAVPVTLTEIGASPDITTVTSTANVAEGDAGALNSLTITPTEGVAFSGAVASFTDPGNPLQQASDFVATIHWGDGTPTTFGVVSGPIGGPFTISGSHTYAEDGTFHIAAIFSDDPPATLIGIPIMSTAHVSEGTFGVAGVGPISVTEGQPFSGTLATFSDPGSPDPAADFTATVDWGDGTTTTGTVTGAGGNFTVSGSHTYVDELVGGAINVTVSEPDANFTIGPVADALTVGEGDNPSGTGATITPTEGLAFSGAVATFTDTGYPANIPADFTATIDWGDGTTTTTGTVTGAGGSFTVSGSHTYLEENTFTTKVTLNDNAPGTASNLASGTAMVADAPLVASGNFIHIAVENSASPPQVVATFVDLGGPEAVGNYSADIAWGDGSTSGGMIVALNGVFAVVGSHTYADEGVDIISVTIHHETAPAAKTVSFAFVFDPAVVAFGGFTLNATAGASSPPQVVAAFTDPGGAENPALDYSASINWGDQSSSTGTIMFTNGLFVVIGSHNYSHGGTFAVSVTINHGNAAPVSVSDTAIVVGGVPASTLNPFFGGNQLAGNATTVLAGVPSQTQSFAAVATVPTSQDTQRTPISYPATPANVISSRRDVRTAAILSEINDWSLHRTSHLGSIALGD